MFHGGLNGDGFFNEEYENGGHESGEGCGYGYYPPVDINKMGLGVELTGKETEKGVQFKLKDFGNFWMPKKALTNHFNYVEHWGVEIMNNNIKELIARIQKENT